MNSRCVSRYRFFCLLFVTFLLMANTSFAAMTQASTIEISSLIINLGLIALGSLFVYVLVLTITFLFNAYKEAQEHKAHAHTVEAESSVLNPQLNRRSFLSLLGLSWVAFTAATLGALSGVIRFLFPNVTFEPPLKFAAGLPNSYSLGVDERYKEAHRVWVVRETNGFYALSTICTHLGCTPNWLQAEQKFKCPCHGSGYYITGVNFEGPAPRPLPRFNITLTDDGLIQIDESIQYQQELGQWGLPGSYLEYKG
jgi:cytochrome b6-f complex iron-sulfur subunit